MASQTKKITLDTAALFFGRAVGLLLGIVRLNYLATYLGVANFGILNFATYFTALFQSLFDLGMAQLITREISRDPSRSSALLGSAMVLKLVIVLAASLLVVAVTLLSGFNRVTNWAVLLTTAALAVNGISTMFLSAFQAHRKMVMVSIANIANDAIISAAIILMIPSFPSVVTALSLVAIVSTINLGLLIRIYLKVVGRLELKVDIPTWRILLKDGAPVAVSSLAISIYTFVGTTILKYTRGETEVGIFSAGYKLISILTLVPATFSQIVFPIFSDFYKNATHKLSKGLQDSLRMMSEISIPLAV
ncbi:MAG: Polysacc synt protein, partial [Bacteroidetes bacterium]|nr:Polysacc synt protein [Bacteroidota bacterium]